MIYLDNAATTRAYPEVIDVMNEINKDFYANPSSMHLSGFAAEKKMTEAKETLLSLIGAKSGEIIFTSGGTESNNQILLGTIFSQIKRKPHIITSAIEHPSVLEPAKALCDLGCEVTYVSPDENGVISAESIVKEIRDNTRLISVMAVNNETGAINPIADIAKKVKEKRADIIVHSDCVQAMGNIKISVDKWGVDAISLSAHKICGPKGVGALYIRDKVRVLPLILGGHQQKNLRSGTQNLPGIAGFVRAAQITDENFSKKCAHLFTLKETIIKRLKDDGSFLINNEGSMYSSHIVSIRVKNVRAEVLLHALEAHKICISAGSACSTNKPAPSHVLAAQGFDRKHIEETIRVSLGVYNTMDEICEFCDILIKEAKTLSRFTRA
ncbi:MAG: cysteine desulfurase [Clostridia bacterium]|nr:cysteine desulfurase [Clostridia bacterium]